MINKIKNYISEHPLAIIICIAVLIIILLSNIIEKVSKECASQGYGIKAYYTNQGDKFYKCDKDGDK